MTAVPRGKSRLDGPAIGPKAKARKQQVAFLQKLANIKAAKGETDEVVTRIPSANYGVRHEGQKKRRRQKGQHKDDPVWQGRGNGFEGGLGAGSALEVIQRNVGGIIEDEDAVVQDLTGEAQDANEVAVLEADAVGGFGGEGSTMEVSKNDAAGAEGEQTSRIVDIDVADGNTRQVDDVDMADT